MRDPRNRSFQPRLEGLEQRSLMAAGIGMGGMNGGVLGSAVVVEAGDQELTAVVRQSSTYDPSLKEVYIDGSIYDDHVEVVEYTTGANGHVTMKLEQWNDGVMLSSKTVRVETPNMKFLAWAINADLREGSDRLLNNTAGPILASGGAGSDILIGGTGNDFLRGDAGANGLLGRAGDDVIYGGNDADGIYGGAGNDTLRGFGGNDWINGESGDNSATVFGNDRLFGGTGNDVLMGDAGYDELRGEQGNDTMRGGRDNDWMWGGSGNDYMYGESGSDRLYGEADFDRLFGGGDDDYLNGGYHGYNTVSPTDYLEGGQGADRFVQHRSFFFRTRYAVFTDFNKRQRDSSENVWHF